MHKDNKKIESNHKSAVIFRSFIKKIQPIKQKKQIDIAEKAITINKA